MSRFKYYPVSQIIEDKCTGKRYYGNQAVADLLNDLQQEAKDNEHYHSEVLRLYKAVSEKNEQLKQFPVKLENRIQKLQEDLQKLTEMDKSDLNPQAIEDVATVIGISLNALIEFQKELEE